MLETSITEARPKSNIVALPSYSLVAAADAAFIEAADADTVQSTTFPADREGRTYVAAPLCNFDHPALHMTFAERVTLLRGPEEDGID